MRASEKRMFDRIASNLQSLFDYGPAKAAACGYWMRVNIVPI